jgi:DNA-binding MarR family transcriptional regulator
MTLHLVPPIHRATHRIALYLAELREHGLSQGEAHILAHLATGSPATIGALNAALAHKRSTLTSILDRLAQREFITRQVGTDDRRTFVIDTTAKGRKVAREVHAHLAKLEAAIGSRVTSREMQAFLKVLGLVEQQARAATRAGRARR